MRQQPDENNEANPSLLVHPFRLEIKAVAGTLGFSACF